MNLICSLGLGFIHLTLGLNQAVSHPHMPLIDAKTPFDPSKDPPRVPHFRSFLPANYILQDTSHHCSLILCSSGFGRRHHLRRSIPLSPLGIIPSRVAEGRPRKRAKRRAGAPRRLRRSGGPTGGRDAPLRRDDSKRGRASTSSFSILIYGIYGPELSRLL